MSQILQCVDLIVKCIHRVVSCNQCQNLFIELNGIFFIGFTVIVYSPKPQVVRFMNGFTCKLNKCCERTFVLHSAVKFASPFKI